MPDYHVWTPRHRGHEADLTRCRASVYDRTTRWPTNYQCTRKGTIERGGYLWCSQHDPEAVKAKGLARHEQWRRESEAATRKWKEEKRLKDLREHAVIALKSIARGHNDARTLAKEVLETWEEPYEI